MSLFNFFKKDKSPNEVKVEDIKTTKDTSPAQENGKKNEEELIAFDKEVLQMLPRYLSMPNAESNLTLKNEQGEVIHFGDFFPQQFEAWKTTKSWADKKGIIYSLLDHTVGKDLKTWQQIERFNDDRMAPQALKIALENQNEENMADADYWSALARTQLILGRYADAERCCDRSLELLAQEENIRALRIKADILHCTNKHAEAHEIYKNIIDKKIPKDKDITLNLTSILGFDGDIVNSPFYAFGWLSHDQNITQEIWDWANEEFYYSPHFRSQYAYFLIKNNEHLKGLVKLVVLGQEMPWFKEAVLNALNVMEQLNVSEHFVDVKTHFEQLVRENNWTEENMHSV